MKTPIGSFFAAAVSLLGMIPVASAEVIVQDGGIAPLFDGGHPPSPWQYPTDYTGWVAGTGAWDDLSAVWPWPGGRFEPGPHGYDAAGRTLHLSNERRETMTKQLWIELMFTPDTADPFPGPGTPLLDGMWANITAPGSAVELTGAAVRRDPPNSGFLFVTMTFTIQPQPDFEMIDLAPLINSVIDAEDDLMGIASQTICTPAPGSAMLAGLGGLLACRRRR